MRDEWDGPGSDLLCNFRRYLPSNEDISNCVWSCAGDLDGLLDQRRNKISKPTCHHKRLGIKLKLRFFTKWTNKYLFYSNLIMYLADPKHVGIWTRLSVFRLEET